MKTVVTPAWLSQNLSQIKILDASWYLPTEARDYRAEFEKAHIEGAEFFDIDAISDQQSTLPHMMPSAADFGRAVGELGISNGDTIIVYDTAGLFSAARVWWMFKTMGHEEVYVLDGGLPAWIAAGLPVVSGTSSPKEGLFQARLDASKIYEASDVLQTPYQVLDARPPARFKGEAAEPRPNTRSGHIPNSINLFFKELLEPDARLKSPDAIRKILADKGVDANAPIVTSCGSGVTAAVLVLALHSIEHSDVHLYDGSWSDWGSNPELPISNS